MGIEKLNIRKLEEAVETTKDPNMIRLFNRFKNTGEPHPDLDKIINSGAEENSAEQRKSCI